MPGEEDRLESTLCEPACVRTQHGEKYFKTRAIQGLKGNTCFGDNHIKCAIKILTEL